jgi:hypothetical protein
VLTQRYFDKNFDLMLKPEKRQLMLEKFSASEEYAHFFDGKSIVQVYTPSKEQLEGTLTIKAHDRVVFTCLSPSMPTIAKGGLLLVVPQTNPYIVLVQASADTVVDNYVMLASVDPRRRARYRTRMVGQLFGVARPMYDHIKDHSARVFRLDEYRKNRNGESYLGRVSDRVEDYAKVVHDASAYVGKGRVPAKCLIADISEGGCCLYVAKDAAVDGLAETKLIFLTIEMPHPTKQLEAKLFASVRSMRAYGDHLILHCMYVEPLPQNFLNW